MTVRICRSLDKAIKSWHENLFKLGCNEQCCDSNELKLTLLNQIASFLKVLVDKLNTHVESRASQAEFLRDLTQPAQQGQSHVFCKLSLPIEVIISNPVSKLYQ